jgi:hypothetical protein
MPQESTDFLDKTQQEVMMAHIVRCPRFYSFVQGGKINQEDFDWVYLRVVFQCAVGVLTIQGCDSPVTVHSLMDQYKLVRQAAGLNPAEENQVLNFLVYTYNLAPSEAYYLGKLEDFIGQMRMYREVRKFKVHDWKTISTRLQTISFDAQINTGRPYKPLMNFQMTPEIETVPTGIRCLDRKLSGGGLGRKEYGILCAYTGVGKTTLALNFLWGAARYRRKAAIATLELDKYKCTERLYSLIGDYDYDAIRYGRMPHQSRQQCWDEAVSRVQQRSGEFGEYMDIWDFSQEVCTISILEEWIKRENSLSPNHPLQMLVIDWLLCLDEDMRTFKPGEMKPTEVRHKLQRYSTDIAKLAIRNQLAIWATHQADAKAEDQEIVTTKHSAEGKSAAWKCSVYLGVGTTPEKRKNGEFTATASKTRDGQTFSVPLRGNLARQVFFSPDEEGRGDPSSDQIEMSNATGDLIDPLGMAEGFVPENNDDGGPPPPPELPPPPPPP